MSKTTFVVLLAISFFLAMPVFAHPGNTASDGCHYCRTNCAKWGEAYGARHCHGGGVSIPRFTPKVTLPTRKPAIPSPAFTPSPRVRGTQAPVANVAPTKDTDDSGSIAGWVLGLAVVGAVAYWYGKRR